MKKCFFMGKGNRNYTKGYRPPSSYHSKDPLKREKQLANLMRGRKKRQIKPQECISTDPHIEKYRYDIIGWLETFYFIPETKKSIALEDWQKERIFKSLFEPDSRTKHRRYSLGLIGMPKKNGKSTIASAIACFFIFQNEENGEITFIVRRQVNDSSTKILKTTGKIYMKVNSTT